MYKENLTILCAWLETDNFQLILLNSDVILYLGPSAHLLHGISVLLVHYTIFVEGLYSFFFLFSNWENCLNFQKSNLDSASNFSQCLIQFIKTTFIIFITYFWCNRQQGWVNCYPVRICWEIPETLETWPHHLELLE